MYVAPVFEEAKVLVCILIIIYVTVPFSNITVEYQRKLKALNGSFRVAASLFLTAVLIC
jgi:hypothetical protein